MSNYAFDYPTGREIEPEPPSWAYGAEFMTATPEAVAICREYGFRELSEDDIDFERTNRKKLFLKGEPAYFRYHRGTLESAADSCTAFYVLAPGWLVLLERPGAGKVTVEIVGSVPVGREAEPSLRIRPNWMPGQPLPGPRR